MAGVGPNGPLARLIGPEEGSLARLSRRGAEQGTRPGPKTRSQEGGVLLRGPGEGGGAGPPHQPGAGQGAPQSARRRRAHATTTTTAVEVSSHTSLNTVLLVSTGK